MGKAGKRYPCKNMHAVLSMYLVPRVTCVKKPFVLLVEVCARTEIESMMNLVYNMRRFCYLESSSKS